MITGLEKLFQVFIGIVEIGNKSFYNFSELTDGNKFLIMNPDAPSLYGPLKLHKHNKGIRFNNCMTVLQTLITIEIANVKLSTYSATKFKELTNFKPK